MCGESRWQKEDRGMVWGRWLLARKTERVLEIAGHLNGENQNWNRNGKDSMITMGECSEESIQSFHWRQSLLSTREF